MHFIVATDMKRVDGQTRKLIRSQVMKGKNKTKSRKPKRQKQATGGILVDSASTPLVSLERLVECCCSFIPRRPGTDLSCSNFTEELDAATFGNIIEFWTVSMRVKFPLGSYTHFEIRDRTWLNLLSIDPAYLHITAFAAYTFMDIIMDRQANSESTFHYLKGVQILRQRLEQDDQDTQVSDSTISVVLTLAITAHVQGEYQTAKYHMEGICKMIDMRGGLERFRTSGCFCKKLLLEILRCDIGMALHTGSTSTFFSDPISEPFLPPPDLMPLIGQDEIIHKYDINEHLENIDENLLEIWELVRKFCAILNFAAKTSWKFSPDTITNTIASVMYPLLYMSFKIGSANEIIRLGLLCFCNSAFLQWQDIRMPYDRFSSSYRESFLRPEIEGKIPSKIMLWLLIIGGISVFGIPEDQELQKLLLQHIDICDVKSWEGMQGVMSSILWIGRLHDRPAKAVFDLIVAS